MDNSTPGLSAFDGGDTSIVADENLESIGNINEKIEQRNGRNQDGEDIFSISNAISNLPAVEHIRLNTYQKLAVACGHFLNDLCASLWFSYLLLYFEFVVGFNDQDVSSHGQKGSKDSTYAATLMLIGQIADGLATPIIGYEVDNSNVMSSKYGRCKAWHLFGSCLVLLSFPFVFSPVLGGSDRTAAWIKMLYYAPFIIVFQIGWACVQISHLALIPKAHPDELIRTELFSMRYGFTVIANITIFLLTWLTLQFRGSSSRHCSVDKSDSTSFMKVALIAIGVGLISTIIFHLSVKEESDDQVKRKVAAISSRTNVIRRLSSMEPSDLERLSPTTRENNPLIGSDRIEEEDNRSDRVLVDDAGSEEAVAIVQAALQEIELETQISVTYKRPVFSTTALSHEKLVMKVKDWFLLPQTYVVAFIYMATRLSVNLGQVYVPLYVQESLRITCTNVATIPLTMYLSGFVMSFFIKLINKHFGRQISFTVGALLGVVGSSLVLFLDWDGPNSHFLKSYIVYIMAVFLGAAASAILITSLSITADLIGNNIESGAFVYGTMSFCDKISSGLTVLLINSLVPCSGPTCTAQNVKFYRDVLGYSTGGCGMLGVLGVLILTYLIFVQKSKKSEDDNVRREPEPNR